MQFIHAAMLLGVLGVAIPIIIQILNRKHTSKVMWGAMIFLLDSLRKRRKRVLLEEILLLACRCLLPALAALALARPFIPPESSVPWVVVMPLLLLSITAFGVSFALWRHRKWRIWTMVAAVFMFLLAAGSVLLERELNLKRFGRGATKDVVLIVDGSSSMSMVREGESNFERAVKEVEKYIDEAPKGTAFSLIVGGPVPQVLNVVPIADKRVLRDTVKQLRLTQGTMQILPTLAAAAVTLASGNNGVKQIVIIGDGQSVGWNFGSAERWGTIKQIFEKLSAAPQIIWRTVSLPASIRNIGISKVSLSRDIVGTDRDVGINVTIVNTGTEAVTPDEVTLRIGSAIKQSGRSIGQLEPGASHTLTFRHKFERAGAAVVEATVTAGDDLPFDDVFSYVVPVMDSLRVLVVDGSAAPDMFRKASTFTSLALRPDLNRLQGGAAGGADADLLLAAEVKSLPAVVTMRDFAEYGVVILADVPRLPAESLAALAKFVSMGGGLFVMPGARADASAYNNWSFGGAPVLPMSLGAFTNANNSASSARSAAAAKTAPVSIAPDSFTHDALRNLRVGSDLGSVQPMQYWKLDSGLTGDAYTAGKLSDGSPFIALKPLGRGTVALSAFVFDAVASDIVSRRSFVPLMHEVTYHLARPVGAALNVLPSDGATLLLASQTSAASSSDSRNGLIGSYYKQRDRKGEAIRRVDKVVDFNWGGGSPMPGIPADYFSVAWNGTLIPKENGRYEFHVDKDDEASLKINGKTVAGALELRAGTRYAIQLEFAEGYGDARCRLLWSKDGGGQHIIPTEVLLPIGMSGEGSGEITAVTDPYGEIFSGEVFVSDAGTVLRVRRSLVPGLYRAEVPGAFARQLASATGEDGKIVFSVVAGMEESDIKAATPEQTEFLNQFISISTATKPEDVIKVLHGQSFGKEIWRILAIAAFIFLIVEVVLTRWISIQRRSGEERDIDFTNDGKANSAAIKSFLQSKGK